MQTKHWLEVIRAAVAQYRRPTKPQCYAIALQLFPDLMAADMEARARRGHMNKLAAVMRTAGNIDEDDDGPTVQMNLPGMQAPAYLTVPDPEGGLTLVEYAKSFRPERRAAIDIRNNVVGRIQTRVRDLEQKERYLAPFTPDDQTTVEQAIARAEARQHRTDSPSQDDQPGAPA